MGKVGKAKAKAKDKPIEQQLKYVGPTDPKAAARQSAWTRLAFLLTLSLDICFAVVSASYSATKSSRFVMIHNGEIEDVDNLPR